MRSAESGRESESVCWRSSRDGIAACYKPVLPPLTWRLPLPHFHESLWGVLQKLSHLNVLDLIDRRQLLDVDSDGNCRLDRLRASIGMEDTRRIWSLLTMEPIAAAPGQPSKLEALRYCETCLAYGFHSVLFQMPELSRCPAHDVELRDRCASCGSPIAYRLWHVPGLAGAFECGCGRLLWPHRDVVARWYDRVQHLNRLNAFGHRLLTQEQTSSRLWFRIDNPAIGVSHESSLAQRLGAICPAELLKLPRVYRHFLSQDLLGECFDREDLELPGPDGADAIAVVPWLARLLERVERDVVASLCAHKHCLEDVSRLITQEGPALSLERCALANTLVLWRAHWSSTVVKLELSDAVEWCVRGTVSALRNRRIFFHETPDGDGLGSETLAVTKIAAVPPWRALSEVLARQVLLTSFVNAANFIRSLAEDTDRSHQTHRWACPDHHPLRTEIPRLWAVFDPERPRVLQIRHRGCERLRMLNRWSCRNGCDSQENFQVSVDQQALAMESHRLRAALDRGLSFAQLGAGRTCN
jgi:hypothetical protein